MRDGKLPVNVRRSATATVRTGRPADRTSVDPQPPPPPCRENLIADGDLTTFRRDLPKFRNEPRRECWSGTSLMLIRATGSRFSWRISANGTPPFQAGRRRAPGGLPTARERGLAAVI